MAWWSSVHQVKTISKSWNNQEIRNLGITYRIPRPFSVAHFIRLFPCLSSHNNSYNPTTKSLPIHTILSFWSVIWIYKFHKCKATGFPARVWQNLYSQTKISRNTVCQSWKWLKHRSRTQLPSHCHHLICLPRELDGNHVNGKNINEYSEIIKSSYQSKQPTLDLSSTDSYATSKCVYNFKFFTERIWCPWTQHCSKLSSHEKHFKSSAHYLLFNTLKLAWVKNSLHTGTSFQHDSTPWPN